MAHLRSNVIGRATESLGGDSIPDTLFAHAKISNFDVALGVQHHVVKFQVSVVTERMRVGEGGEERERERGKRE